MPGQRSGSLIGAVFGLVYVVVNAGPLPTAARVPVRVLGIAAFLAVLTSLIRRRPASAGSTPSAPAGHTRPFGAAYWAVVAAEAVALFGGLAVLNGVLHRPQAGVAWVSVVVGAHFFALAWVFEMRFFHLLGGIIILCGVTGLALVAGEAGAAPVAVIGGLLPGVVLLAFGWRGAHSLPLHRQPGSATQALPGLQERNDVATRVPDHPTPSSIRPPAPTLPPEEPSG
jgi:hypothetical protein